MASRPPQASFALQSANERSLLITEAAARLGLAELILEKDFWVGWLLGRLFAMPRAAGQFVFKGGTSLSMVFGAVRRFSEDIDLAILPAALGFEESYFNEAPSASQRRKRMLELAQGSEALVQQLHPFLEAEVTSQLGPSPQGAGWFSYEIDSNAGTPNLWFSYPSVTAQQSNYVAKRVKLEFGSLTNQQSSKESRSPKESRRHQDRDCQEGGAGEKDHSRQKIADRQGADPATGQRKSCHSTVHPYREGIGQDGRQASRKAQVISAAS